MRSGRFAIAALLVGLGVSTGAGWALGASGFSGYGSFATRVGPYFMQPSNTCVTTDAAGVPIVMYEGKAEYNPTIIAGQGLRAYNEWFAGHSERSFERFVQLADWMVAHQESDGLWLYTFAFGPQPVPWWSALAQGHALALLSRAYQETGDGKYRVAAERALKTFTRSPSARGVKIVESGYAWFEEYMKPRKPHTLNGFMFALAGVHDYNMVFGDRLSLSIWNSGIRTIEQELHRFDTGGWACYSLSWLTPIPKTGQQTTSERCQLASLSYQQIHVWQLRALADWTGSSRIREYADRWAGYLERPPASVLARADAAGPCGGDGTVPAASPPVAHTRSDVPTSVGAEGS